MRFCPHGVNCNSRPEKNRKGSHFFLSCMNLFPQKMEDSFVSKTASRVETCLCFQSHGSASMCLMVTRFVTHTHISRRRNASKQHCIFPHIFFHSRRYHVWVKKRGLRRRFVVWSQMARRHFTKRVRLRNISWPASWHCRRTLGLIYHGLHRTALYSLVQSWKLAREGSNRSVMVPYHMPVCCSLNCAAYQHSWCWSTGAGNKKQKSEIMTFLTKRLNLKKAKNKLC